MPDYDVAIIGSGPAGYVAAIRAAQLGMKTALVERSEVGGICLNWGCIPSKALLRNAEVLSLFRRADDFGITVDGLQPDYGKAIDRSREVVGTLTRGLAFLLRRNKVEVVKEEGQLAGGGVVTLTSGNDSLSAGHVILATGARPRELPGLPVDHRVVVTSREALEQRDLPERVVIVGGGAVGVEFAYVYNAYGAQVTIVEMLPHLLPSEDEEISRELERALSRQGITVQTETQVRTFQGGSNPKVTISGKNGDVELGCDQVLVAVGVKPNTEDLGLEEIGVETEHGFIKIDEGMATSALEVYAIGDVTGKVLLAHVGMAQGVAAVERIAGLEVPTLNYVDMPRATYCLPQVGSFGLTERQAREQGYEVKVGKFPFQASGKALALGEGEGMVKVVADAQTGEVLGAHMIGAEVTELLGEASLARLLEGTTQEVGWLVHSHPSLSEALKEAALAAQDRAIHM